MIVEWSLGSPQRFHWDGQKLVPHDPPWQPGWGLPPVNYGLVPEYHNPADNAELDAVWAGQVAIPAGTVLTGEVLGMVWLEDGDHKLILGEPAQPWEMDLEGLLAWFAGRGPRLASKEEAVGFVQSLPRRPTAPPGLRR
ncbi:hypothetical protein [Meiothermus sp. QL-1]|uniref:hypothetical protein n=1 Tax=Meiothermus sp. QL-1 TaxID=2058095 RepID=UPI001F292856|nr:hypothetical protein [Meiothermus sp. QL-1]